MTDQLTQNHSRTSDNQVQNPMFHGFYDCGQYTNTTGFNPLGCLIQQQTPWLGITQPTLSDQMPVTNINIEQQLQSLQTQLQCLQTQLQAQRVNYSQTGWSHLNPQTTANNLVGNTFIPAHELVEDKNNFNLFVELAGLNKGDFLITVNQGCVTISGTKTGYAGDHPVTVGNVRHGAFEHRFMVTPNIEFIDAKKVKCTYTDGVLCVSIAKTVAAAQCYQTSSVS